MRLSFVSARRRVKLLTHRQRQEVGCFDERGADMRTSLIAAAAAAFCIVLTCSAPATAQPNASFSIPVAAAVLDGATLVIGAIVLPASDNSTFAFDFVLPRNYVNDTEVLVVLNLSADDSPCILSACGGHDGPAACAAPHYPWPGRPDRTESECRVSVGKRPAPTIQDKSGRGDARSEARRRDHVAAAARG